MAKHHGMNQLEGMHAFCNYGHEPKRGDRFGRIFKLPPLHTDAKALQALGAPGGPMDGGSGSDRTDSVPVGQIFFGQFVDHDITLDVTSSLSRVNQPEDTPNTRTPTLDLDNIYGAGPEASAYLYHQTGDYAGVKLLTGADGTAARIDNGGGTLIPQPPNLAENDLCRSAHGTAIIGDGRNDENRVISQLQLAMIRFHNNAAECIHNDGIAGEEVPEEELFEVTLRQVRWHYQWVILNELLPHICGQAVVDDILGNGRRFYCPTTEIPFIPIEFAVAAYRFGHSMIPQKVQIQKGGSALEVFGRTLGRGFSPLSDEDAVVDWHELTETSENRHVQNAEKLDGTLAADLLDLPFIREGESSLATRNLLRGQAFQLPSGENVARAMERPEDEIENVTDAARAMAPDVDLSSGTPLWFYLLVEAERVGRESEPEHFDEGEGLGPVGARIVGETIVGLIERDPRSFLAQNRSWHPMIDGLGVTTLGQMLTFKPVPLVTV